MNASLAVSRSFARVAVRGGPRPLPGRKPGSPNDARLSHAEGSWVTQEPTNITGRRGGSETSKETRWTAEPCPPMRSRRAIELGWSALERVIWPDLPSRFSSTSSFEGKRFWATHAARKDTRSSASRLLAWVEPGWQQICTSSARRRSTKLPKLAAAPMGGQPSLRMLLASRVAPVLSERVSTSTHHQRPSCTSRVAPPESTGHRLDREGHPGRHRSRSADEGRIALGFPGLSR